jgi:hypothetical protein
VLVGVAVVHMEVAERLHDVAQPARRVAASHSRLIHKVCGWLRG